jgi:hypothetical protein
MEQHRQRPRLGAPPQRLPHNLVGFVLQRQGASGEQP